MILNKKVKYGGTNYEVRAVVQKEEETQHVTIGAVEKQLHVNVWVLNSLQVEVYKTNKKISLTNKNSLVDLIKDSVRAAHDKVNLEQLKRVNSWDGNIDKEIEEVNALISGKGLIIKSGNKVIIDSENGVLDFDKFTPIRASAYELLKDVKINEYKKKGEKVTLIGFNDNIITKLDADDEKIGERLVNYNPNKIKLGNHIIYDKELGYIDFTKFTIEN
ncbi:hypothetical protein [Priestia megaterium]|uniref:hypothetical protein n=1 Tax=Priestia megaterium TaxID=1404 RepID=UPI002877DA4D|nr:hypothetical protein [Priestia megaterium]